MSISHARPWLPLLLIDGALLLSSLGTLGFRGIALSAIALALTWTIRRHAQPIALGVVFVTAGLINGAMFPWVGLTAFGGLLVLHAVLSSIFRIGSDNTVARGSTPRPLVTRYLVSTALTLVALFAFAREAIPLVPALFALTLTVSLFFERARRYAVLGVFERLERMIQLMSVATFALLGVTWLDRSVAWLLYLASMLLTRYLAETDRFERVLPITRTAALQFVYGAPLVVLAWLTLGPHSSLLAGVTSGLVTLSVAAIAAARERTFLDDEGRLLSALDEARADLHDADATTALTTTLLRLRKVAPPDVKTSPRMFSLFESVWKSVDAAGYPTRSTDRPPPPLALELAKKEPYGLLRRDALQSMAVRRGELRPLVDWFERDDILALAILRRGDSDEGALLLPSWGRRHGIVLEEAIAIHRLAIELAWLEHYTSVEKRSRTREQAVDENRKNAEEERAAALAKLDRVVMRERHVLGQGAKRATFGNYSPAMRDAESRTVELLRARKPFAVRASAGSRVVAALAALREKVGMGEKPFVVVDTAYAEETNDAVFLDPLRSPLALALGGHLILLGQGQLSPRVSELLTNYVNVRRLPWQERPSEEDAVVLFVAPSPFAGSAYEAGLNDPLVEVEWPRLADRPEDLHAILADELARLGVRKNGTPLGLSDQAFARVVESHFAADERHLEALAAIVVELAEEPVVTASTMDRALALLDLRTPAQTA